jgi:hypothetical protein
MRRIAISIFFCAGAGVACAPRTRIVLPPDAAHEWSYTPSGDSHPSRHVIRMSDGTRDWEVDFPDVATGYEVRIPLRGGAAGDGRPESTPAHLTAAYREMLEERAVEPASEKVMAAGGEKKVGAQPARGEAAASKKKRPSYLGGIARVRELYRTRNYELALIDCVDLEREYPGDEKLLAMKGSIYRKLGKPKLARETWEKVLAVNPDNSAVSDALKELAGEQQEEGGR